LSSSTKISDTTPSCQQAQCILLHRFIERSRSDCPCASAQPISAFEGWLRCGNSVWKLGEVGAKPHQPGLTSALAALLLHKPKQKRPSSEWKSHFKCSVLFFTMPIDCCYSQIQTDAGCRIRHLNDRLQNKNKASMCWGNFHGASARRAISLEPA
jgi:hypothetical protein